MLPKDVSSYGYLIDNLIALIFYISLFVTVISFGVIVYAAIKYRKSNHPKASYELGKFISKIVYLDAIMIVFDVIIATVSISGWNALVMKGPEELKREHGKFVEVQVIGRQFFWAINYTGADGKFGTNDDFTSGNYMAVPADTLVLVKLTSGDVIHSFFAPNLRIKYDAIPGRDTFLWFKAKETGQYEVACAELCGPYHYKMKAIIDVMPGDKYQDWVRSKSNVYARN